MPPPVAQATDLGARPMEAALRLLWLLGEKLVPLLLLPSHLAGLPRPQALV